MAMRMTYTADLEAWLAPLREAGRRAQNATPAFRQVGEFLLGSVVDRNFDSQGTPSGSWPELSEATLIARARGRSGKAQVWKKGVVRGAKGQYQRGGGVRQLTARAARIIESAKALIFSGRLLRSMTYDAFSDYVDVGSNLVQAARLFWGSRPGVHPVTPARNPFLMTADDEASITRIFMDFFFGGSS